MQWLVLSLFPGIGLLDRAFELEGFTVVRGPDLLWGGDVHSFHAPPDRFDGVIGGPPCQAHSRLAVMAARSGTVAPDLIPEFERIVEEARPAWFLMENVPGAQEPAPAGFDVVSRVVDNFWMAETVQGRIRRFSFGLDRELEWPLRFHVETPAKLLVAGTREPAVIASGGGRPNKKRIRDLTNAAAVAESCRLQGLPADFLERAPFTQKAKQEVIGNGVPLPMGRAVARAVRAALTPPSVRRGLDEIER